MIPPNIQEIISRHEARLKACGDKLMNAERDLSVVLEWLHTGIFVPRETMVNVHITLVHARTFIHSREKMHPDGQDMYQECIEQVEEALRSPVVRSI